MEPKKFCRGASLINSTVLNTNGTEPIQSIKIALGSVHRNINQTVILIYNAIYTGVFPQPENMLWRVEWVDTIKKAMKNEA